MHEDSQTLRIDKWLWVARFYKTRSLAAQAVERQRIKLNGLATKPAKEVRAGDWLLVTNDSGEYEIQVVALAELRGPAKFSQTLYAETEASKKAREKAQELRRLQPEPEAQRAGRPTKKEPRELNRWRGGAD